MIKQYFRQPEINPFSFLIYSFTKAWVFFRKYYFFRNHFFRGLSLYSCIKFKIKKIVQETSNSKNHSSPFWQRGQYKIPNIREKNQMERKLKRIRRNKRIFKQTLWNVWNNITLPEYLTMLIRFIWSFYFKN